ncbi:MAG: hypothetical protein EHM45_08130 [Desulfobacteraceae bacterium]|nr:MAG: hypothetical protein EHM45_08130 [Desulfobacteraceae bacterium]
MGLSSHLKRWLTALVGLPILYYLVALAPRWQFYGFLLWLCVTGLYEIYHFPPKNVPVFIQYSMYASAFILFGTAYYYFFALPFVIFSWAVIPFLYYLATFRSAPPHFSENIARTVLGPVYICMPLAMLMLVDRVPNGFHYILFWLVIIFMTDTGAFYSGRLFGKRKLYEAISPSKTVAGAVGGVVFAAGSVFLFPYLFWLGYFIFSFIGGERLGAYVFPYVLRAFPYSFALIGLAMALSISGQIGDLVESMLKRDHGVKDSGNILPGHGGILDRLDSLLFSIPVLYLYLTWGARA